VDPCEARVRSPALGPGPRSLLRRSEATRRCCAWPCDVSCRRRLHRRYCDCRRQGSAAAPRWLSPDQARAVRRKAPLTALIVRRSSGLSTSLPRRPARTISTRRPQRREEGLQSLPIGACRDARRRAADRDLDPFGGPVKPRLWPMAPRRALTSSSCLTRANRRAAVVARPAYVERYDWLSRQCVTYRSASRGLHKSRAGRER
jgi:hypothetical protein